MAHRLDLGKFGCGVGTSGNESKWSPASFAPWKRDVSTSFQAYYRTKNLFSLFFMLLGVQISPPPPPHPFISATAYLSADGPRFSWSLIEMLLVVLRALLMVMLLEISISSSTDFIPIIRPPPNNHTPFISATAYLSAEGPMLSWGLIEMLLVVLRALLMDMLLEISISSSTDFIPIISGMMNSSCVFNLRVNTVITLQLCLEMKHNLVSPHIQRTELCWILPSFRRELSNMIEGNRAASHPLNQSPVMLLLSP